MWTFARVHPKQAATTVSWKNSTIIYIQGSFCEVIENMLLGLFPFSLHRVERNETVTVGRHSQNNECVGFRVKSLTTLHHSLLKGGCPDLKGPPLWCKESALQADHTFVTRMSARWIWRPWELTSTVGRPWPLSVLLGLPHLEQTLVQQTEAKRQRRKAQSQQDSPSSAFSYPQSQKGLSFLYWPFQPHQMLCPDYHPECNTTVFGD